MPFIGFDEMFSKDFRDPEFIPLYLEETLNMEIPTFLLALRHVIKANCTPLEASASRVTLTECGIAEFQALQAALASVGMRFSIVPAEAQSAENAQNVPAETAQAA